MIKFIRKIRRRLFSEKRFGKYLLYAAGEITLVVIGILIALQINNWNEKRKLNQVKSTYYNQLLADFERENNNINEILNFLDKSIESYSNYREVFNEPHASNSEILFALFKIEYTYRPVNFNANTIQTLENTGDIKIVSPIIRDKLVNLQRGFENITETSKSNNSHYLTALMKANELGLNDLSERLKHNDKLRIQVQSETNIAKLIVAADGAFALKNFTESLLVKELNLRLEEIDILKKMILQENK